jgi:hypothetical protein
MILMTMALLAIVFVPTASAQFSLRPIDKSTLLTFTSPVALPNVTLPAGSYLFRFADPVNAPDVLSVTSEDGKTTFATINTIPILRIETKSSNNEIVTFRERPVNAPWAIAAWYFDASEATPGSTDQGCELIYTK